MEDKIETEYVFQEGFIDYQGEHFEREKPYGTSFAVYSAKNNIDGNFLVINSDDFYGRDAFNKASEFLKSIEEPNHFGLVCYQVNNTLTENGSVKRGVCETKEGFLSNIIESKIEKKENGIVASPLSGSESFLVDEDCLVSMNVLLFTPYVFDLIEEYLPNFIEELKEDREKCEYLIPDVIQKGIKDEKIKVSVLKTTAKWEGVTYKEDKPELVKAIQTLVDEGVYNQSLWEE